MEELATYPRHGEDPDTLLRNADSAMYRVNYETRDDVQFYATEMNARIGDRLALASALHRALDRQEFELHYQPQIDLATGKIFGIRGRRVQRPVPARRIEAAVPY